MNELERYGFVVNSDKDDFDSVFNGKMLKEIHIDAFSNEPYQLFSRMVEKDIRIAMEDDRVILRRKDGLVVMNVLFDSICEYVVNKYSNYCYQFVFYIQNIMYKVLFVL